MIRMADLFAGIGGMRLAAERAAEAVGVETETVFACEKDKFCWETYIANFPSPPGKTLTVGLDIRDVGVGSVPDFDLLLAGFPCPPFSNAGKKKGFSDPDSGDMFFEILRFLRSKRPPMFLLENVKGLQHHDGGETLELMLGKLGVLGYRVRTKVLKSTDFGLPQNRHRLFFVGFMDHSIEYHWPSPHGTVTRVGDLLEDPWDVPEKYTVSDRGLACMKRRKEKYANQGGGFGHSVFRPEDPYINTLLARYHKDGKEALIHQEGKNPRRLTPRECARFQGFPNWFKFPVSDTQAYRQIGNSVPVNVVLEIAVNMFCSWRTKDGETVR